LQTSRKSAWGDKFIIYEVHLRVGKDIHSIEVRGAGKRLEILDVDDWVNNLENGFSTVRGTCMECARSLSLYIWGFRGTPKSSILMGFSIINHPAIGILTICYIRIFICHCVL